MLKSKLSHQREQIKQKQVKETIQEIQYLVKKTNIDYMLNYQVM